MHGEIGELVFSLFVVVAFVRAAVKGLLNSVFQLPKNL